MNANAGAEAHTRFRNLDGKWDVSNPLQVLRLALADIRLRVSAGFAPASPSEAFVPYERPLRFARAIETPMCVSRCIAIALQL